MKKHIVTILYVIANICDHMAHTVEGTVPYSRYGVTHANQVWFRGAMGNTNPWNHTVVGVRRHKVFGMQYLVSGVKGWICESMLEGA